MYESKGDGPKVTRTWWRRLWCLLHLDHDWVIHDITRDGLCQITCRRCGDGPHPGSVIRPRRGRKDFDD